MRITSLQFRVLALFVLSLSLLKGIRLPTRFALTHYLFSYREGFIRRGFLGSLLAPFEPYTYWELAGFAFGLLAFFLFITWRLLSQDARSGVRSALPWLAFLASPGLVFFFHIVGYLDYVLVGAVWAVILFSKRIGSTATQVACFVLSPILLLVHEVAIVLVIPSLFFLILLANENNPGQALRRATAFTVLSIGVLVLLVQTGSLEDSERRSVTTSLSQRATFELRRDAIAVLFYQPAGRVAKMNKLNSDKDYQKRMVSSLFLFMPTTLLFIWLSLRLCRSQAAPRQRIAALAIIGVGLSPLLLHIVAFDAHRWHALSNLASFTTWLAMSRSCQTNDIRPTSAVHTAVVLLLILNLSGTNYFFPQHKPQYFPEYDHIDTLKSWGNDDAVP